MGAASSSSEDHSIIEMTSSEHKSPARGSRLRYSAKASSSLLLDLMHLGKLTPELLDAAGQHIEVQLNQVGLQTPMTARTINMLRQRLGDEVERQKNVLANSAGDFVESLRESSSKRSSSSSSSSFSSSSVSIEELHDLLRAVQIANTILTQNAVRAQDDRERAVEESASNKKWAYVGTSLGFAGIAVSIIFGITTFI